MNNTNSNKKLILTRIIKIMILLIGFSLLYILLASTSIKPHESQTVFIKSTDLENLSMDVLLIKSNPIAVIKSGEQWHFLNAQIKSSGCVVKVLNNQTWVDVCSKNTYSLYGKAQGNYRNLQKLQSKALEKGFQILF